MRRNVITRLEICSSFGFHIALSWDVTSCSFVYVAKVSVLPVADVFRLMEASGSQQNVGTTVHPAMCMVSHFRTLQV